MSIKLTNDLRDRIVTRVLNATFAERDEAHKQKGFALARAVYNDVFGVKMIQQMDALPEGWMPRTNVMKIIVAGNWVELRLGDYVRIPASKNTSCLTAYEATNKLAERYAELVNTEVKIKRQKDELKAKVRALVNSVTTVKKLIEVWPEAVEYIPQPTLVPKLPALCADDINAAITKFKEAA